MPRELDHLELSGWREPLASRLHGGRGAPPRPDRSSHGQTIERQAETVANRLQERARAAPIGINPKLVFKLELHPQGNLSEDQLRQLGLRVLARDKHHAVVVFPDDAALNELRSRLREYAGLVADGHRHAELAAIEALTELTPEDRVGRRLRASPLATDEVAALDVELWHSGDEVECRRWIRELSAYLDQRGLRVTDWWVGTSICLLRARMNAAALDTLLAIDYVKEIDRRPAPSFEMLDVIRVEPAQLDIELVPTDGLTGIVVVDSGVMQGHPLLGPAIGDAQLFPDRLRTRVTGGAEDGDNATAGHGTAVAGIAVYNDVGECIQQQAFRPLARLFSARVTDDRNEYDEDELVEHQLKDAVEYFLNNYPSAKVVNISLGDQRLVYEEGNYQFRFAAAIDELAYRHRDREIVFVVSSGNYLPDDRAGEEVFGQYPAYLIGDDRAHIIDPATSALAITVGGLSWGWGRDYEGRLFDRGTERPVAGERGWPSPFTRTGWGVDGAIKPEVVDLAGDLRFERGRVLDTMNPMYAGLPTTAKNFAPPDGRLFRTVAGTSFAAPRVANIAARLFSELPNASSNLVRALIASSARIPSARPEHFSRRELWDDDVLRVYGYGQPDFARARWSDENDVLLVYEGSLEVDSFQLFTVPSLPREFLSASGRGSISVALAFDPPTRHTRGDSYLGVTMEFALYKNVPPAAVADAIRAWSAAERENLEDRPLPTRDNFRELGYSASRLQMNPTTNRRKKGTLQRGLLRVSGQGWRYDGGPLVLAVVCAHKWAPPEITDQRFAVVVSLAHDNPAVNLYAHIRQAARVYQRVRVQARQ